jgi:hypothetical protein
MNNKGGANRRLNFRHALRLKMAEYWLRLGDAEVAWREVNQLPEAAMSHPDVQRVRAQISSRLIQPPV